MSIAPTPDRSGLAFLLRPRWLIALLIVGVVVFAVIVKSMIGSSDGIDHEADTFAVEPGDLVISVVESGTIRSSDQVILKCEVEGRTTILFVVDEGTAVKKGDLLVELDRSKYEDQKIDQEIRVQNAEAAMIRARENLAVTKNQAESDVAEAELNHELAKKDRTKYVEGDYPVERREAETNITLAKEELKRAQEKVKWSRDLEDKEYLSRSELDADVLAEKRREIDLELAEEKLKLLEKYTYDRRMAELNSSVVQTERALERAKRKANADTIDADANLRAKDAEHRQQITKLRKIDEQITKCRITAPVDGLAVYATTVQTRRWSQPDPLREGMEVHERQELIYLPQASSMIAEIQIPEASLKKVKMDQPARVTLDALPGQELHGRVSKIAVMANNQAWWDPSLKVYATEIEIDGDHPDLRTGMSCHVEVVVEEHAEAMFVPVQSVVRRAGQPTVYVLEGGERRRRKIEIGLDNNRVVHVLAGLSAGERVLRAPPLNDENAAAPQHTGSASSGEGKRPAGDAKNQQSQKRSAKSDRGGKSG